MEKPIVQGIAVVLAFLVVLLLAQSFYTTWKKRDILESRKQVLQVVQADHERLKAAYSATQEDFYIEKIARDKLGLIQSGETIILLDSVVATRSGKKIEQEAISDVPIWKEWWKLFF